jgi:membrane-associated protease RseP (regulator of RpoE activity)
MDDLLEYGQAQRGMLGVVIQDVDAAVAEQLELNINHGVLIVRVNEESAAKESKMREGDVITAINNHPVRSVSELQEWVARNRPGKEIDIQFLRGGEELQVKVRLKDYDGNVVASEREVITRFNGLTIENVTYQELANLKLEGGVRVKDLKEGKWKKSGMKESFIIAFIDRVPVDNVEDFNRILEYKRGGILIEGYYPSGEKGTYGLDW